MTKSKLLSDIITMDTAMKKLDATVTPNVITGQGCENTSPIF